jgi:hypothetical protein
MIDIDLQYTAFPPTRYAVGMKRSTVAALLFALAPITTVVRAQTDAMPPENMAPMHEDAKPFKRSTSLTVTFDGHTTTFSVEDLLKLPQQTITAVNGDTGKPVTFSGPLVSDLLTKAGLVASAETHSLILHSSVIATGADGYFVLYSAAELEQMFSSGKSIVAVMQFDLPVPSGIQLVNPLNVKPARWVHGLASLSVMSVAATK